MTSGPHGLYDQGCTRPTMRCTEGSKLARASKSQKAPMSSLSIPEISFQWEQQIPKQVLSNLKSLVSNIKSQISNL